MSSSLQLHPNSGKCSKATTWVCKAPECQLPYFATALEMAVKQGMIIGLHLESRSIIVHLLEKQPSQQVRRKMATLLNTGTEATASKVTIESIEAMDWFHAESWGFVSVVSP